MSKFAICFSSCSYDTDEIKKLYNQGGSESFESTEIIFIKLKVGNG